MTADEADGSYHVALQRMVFTWLPILGADAGLLARQALAASFLFIGTHQGDGRRCLAQRLGLPP